jgi:hypothetical protein
MASERAENAYTDTQLKQKQSKLDGESDLTTHGWRRRDREGGKAGGLPCGLVAAVHLALSCTRARIRGAGVVDRVQPSCSL